MSTWSELPPSVPGFYLFRGFRRCGSRAYGENILEPVEICEVMRGGKLELGVALTGRQMRFRMETFRGEWKIIDLELEAARATSHNAA